MRCASTGPARSLRAKVEVSHAGPERAFGSLVASHPDHGPDGRPLDHRAQRNGAAIDP